MRDFLFASCVPALWIISAIHVLFMILLFTKYAKTKNILFLLSGLLTFGLFYDAMILALGSVMQESTAFFILSKLRYILHGALIPLIFALCAYALKAKGFWLKAVWGLTIVLSVLGIADGCIRELTVQTVAGVCRYADAGTAPAFFQLINNLLTFGTVIPLMIVGIVVWVKQKTPFLFLAGFLMFAFSGLGAACLELMFYISMYGEILMALFFFLYAQKTSRS